MPRVHPPLESPDLRARITDRLRARHAVVVGWVEDLLERPHANSERLRRMRAELRRFRAEYRVWRLICPRGVVERARVLDGRISELSRRIGEVRDFDVHLQLLGEGDARDEDDRVREHREELTRGLGDDARIGRELLRAYLRAERDAGLFDEIASTLAPASGAGPGATGSSRILRELGRRTEQLAKVFRRTVRHPTTGRAHRLRVQLRRTRYLFEFLATVSGARAPRYPRRLAELQQQLGKVHDLDLLADWIEGLSADLRDADWAKNVRRRRKAEWRRLLVELERRSLRQVIRGLAQA
ncbi:MAG TPA: CHAD domain-containing protein [Thermoplasmata archaeon]|nr:CHAD domain-containing protein [Thermoplasmata archaeon]